MIKAPEPKNDGPMRMDELNQSRQSLSSSRNLRYGNFSRKSTADMPDSITYEPLKRHWVKSLEINTTAVFVF